MKVPKMSSSLVCGIVFLILLCFLLEPMAFQQGVGSKRKKTILDEPHYKAFCLRYMGDCTRFAIEVCGLTPTWQQKQLFDAVSQSGARVACKSGHGTGKSTAYAVICCWHLMCFPESNTLLTANNIDQVRSVVWKELDGILRRIYGRFPWLTPYFIKETKRFYAKGFKDSWFVLPKTAPKYKPESMAGMHRKFYLILIDEASAIEDDIIEVLKGGLTSGPFNRFAMISQPTRITGHFADAFRTMAGQYTALLTFNSEVSPLVDINWILERYKEYGGHHSPQYQIRVLGNFPDQMGGYLIPRSWIEKAQKIRVRHADDWGWVMTCDVGGGVGRDSSVMNIARVSGYDEDRIVEPVFCREMPGNMDPKQFGRMIYSEAQKYPGITVGIDSDGPGLATALEAEELGVNVVRIHWGRPPHADTHKKLYQDQRAYASVWAREAVLRGRMRVLKGTKVVEQAVKIPWTLDRRGRYVIMPKDQMRSEGISSPDIWDTYCFFALVDYTPAGDYQGYDEDREEQLKWAKEILDGGGGEISAVHPIEEIKGLDEAWEDTFLEEAA